MLHLQQTDGQSDSHWGFSTPGIVDLFKIRDLLKDGPEGIPVVLELFYSFEAADDYAWEEVQASVKAVRQSWGYIQGDPD